MMCVDGRLNAAACCCDSPADDNSLNYAAILDTAADIARAMLHLHKNQVRVIFYIHFSSPAGLHGHFRSISEQVYRYTCTSTLVL